VKKHSGPLKFVVLRNSVQHWSPVPRGAASFAGFASTNGSGR
jgi:hypothetical protein